MFCIFNLLNTVEMFRSNGKQIHNKQTDLGTYTDRNALLITSLSLLLLLVNIQKIILIY